MVGRSSAVQFKYFALSVIPREFPGSPPAFPGNVAWIRTAGSPLIVKTYNYGVSMEPPEVIIIKINK